MAASYQRTIEILAGSRNPEAVDLLIVALLRNPAGSPLRDAAVSALLQHEAARGHLELIRQWPTLSDAAWEMIRHQVDRLNHALRQALLHADGELRQNALDITRITGNYALLSTLVELLAGRSGHDPAAALDTFRTLVRNLYDHCVQSDRGRRDSTAVRHAEHIRQTVLTDLDQVCVDYDALAFPEPIVEAILILGSRTSPAVQRVLRNAGETCRELAAALLLSCPHPGIADLVYEELGQNYPHAAVVKAIQLRTDPEFAVHLLKRFPRHLSANQQKNLRQIAQMEWLDPDGPALPLIPQELQPALVELAAMSGLAREKKIDLQQWLLRHGGTRGREAASRILSQMDQSAVRNVVFESLDAADPELQAWATGQLRSQGIPDALQILIDRLDSPEAAVRQAAREQLSSFDLERMLELYDRLDADVCRRAGELIQKIDPSCKARLTRELASPVHRHRVRAAYAARALGLHHHVVGSLTAMLRDEDTLVRRAVAEVLGSLPLPGVEQALSEALDDESVRVRETAAASLDQVRRHRTAEPRQAPLTSQATD